MNAIPGLTRETDPTISKHILFSKLKTIDQRRSEIEAGLAKNPPAYQKQELESEYATLGSMRRDCEEALKPRYRVKPDEEQKQRQLALLRMEIKNQTQLAEHAAEKEEAVGNHRSAKLHRLTIPDIPANVAREYGIPYGLLSEV